MRGCSRWNAAGGPPETSNLYCHPGKAGGSPAHASATRYAVKTAGPGIALRGAKVTLLHMLDGTLRVRFKDRDLAVTPFKTLPTPPPVEDDKTLDARLDAVVARSQGGPNDRARKGVDNGLARYGAMEGALR